MVRKGWNQSMGLKDERWSAIYIALEDHLRQDRQDV
jgi:hypothetical protein